jgi:hypothetical protein
MQYTSERRNPLVMDLRSMSELIDSSMGACLSCQSLRRLLALHHPRIPPRWHGSMRLSDGSIVITLEPLYTHILTYCPIDICQRIQEKNESTE